MSFAKPPPFSLLTIPLMAFAKPPPFYILLNRMVLPSIVFALSWRSHAVSFLKPLLPTLFGALLWPPIFPVQVWGRVAHVLINPTDWARWGGKLAPNMRLCAFIGINSDCPGYLFYAPSSQQLILARMASLMRLDLHSSLPLPSHLLQLSIGLILIRCPLLLPLLLPFLLPLLHPPLRCHLWHLSSCLFLFCSHAPSFITSFCYPPFCSCSPTFSTSHPLHDPCNVQFSQLCSRYPLHILAYVDDLVLLAEDSADLAAVQQALQVRLLCKDLGELYHYLNMEICHDQAARTISHSQSFYIHTIHSILERFEMPLANLVSTPLPANHQLTAPAVRYFFVHELVQSGFLCLRKVAATAILADIFTKALLRVPHRFYVRAPGLTHLATSGGVPAC
ncbi:unnamed protein product [Closterium sp. NIES-54]